MAGKRLAAVQLELSPEQKTILQDLTGESRSSIVIGVSTSPAARSRRNRLTRATRSSSGCSTNRKAT